MGTDTGKQHVKREWFGHDVNRAAVESCDDIDVRTTRSPGSLGARIESWFFLLVGNDCECMTSPGGWSFADVLDQRAPL